MFQQSFRKQVMFTHKIYINKTRNNALTIRLTNDRRKSEFATGIKISEEILKDSMSKSPQPQNKKIKNIIDFYESKILEVKSEILLSNKKFSLQEIVNKVKSAINGENYELGEGSSCFLSYYRKQMQLKTNDGYRKSCEYTYRKILKFDQNAENLNFEDITLSWLSSFDEWLISNGMSQNSRAIHFKNIRTVLSRANDEDLTNNYPFRRFKIKQEATRKRNLPAEDIRRLFFCKVEQYQEFYRDMFKLMFMLCGINAIDLYNLTEITKDGRIEYKRAKTKRLYSIKVEPEALSIINKYRGEKKLLLIADRWRSHKDFTKWLNSNLKKIGETKRNGRGGKKKTDPYWPEITSYWSRHSWATIAYNDCDISKDVISQALGHCTGLSVTEIYLEKDRKKVDKANRILLDWVLYGKQKNAQLAEPGTSVFYGLTEDEAIKQGLI